MEGTHRQGQSDHHPGDRPLLLPRAGRRLIRLATDGPGFAIDEDAATPGERLSLPPFLEPQRAAIEAQLRPITHIELPTSALINITDQSVAPS